MNSISLRRNKRAICYSSIASESKVKSGLRTLTFAFRSVILQVVTWENKTSKEQER